MGKSIELKDFLLNKMKMTGIYQPVVIKFLVKNGGKASLQEIAEHLASIDSEITDYYIQRLKVFPKQVLKKHGIAEIKRGSEAFELIGHSKLSPKQAKEIIQICENKIAQWLAEHIDPAVVTAGWGKLRHEMIADHRYCALCGLTPEDGVKLDVDHIIPKSKGGGDDKANLQVLCHKCNRGKNNHLFKPATEAKKMHKDLDPSCVFCAPKMRNRIVFENQYFFGIWDNYPVTKYHLVQGQQERFALWRL